MAGRFWLRGISARPFALCATVLVWLAASFAASPALAHRQTTDADLSGIAIPGLTHGQMAVIADYRGEIHDLAARQVKTDETFRRILNFGNLQYTYCLWGLMPGSVRDEASPFNECSHAYLAADKALLTYMRGMPGDRAAVEDLVARIDADMVRNRSSFVLCQFSGEAFNTASLVMPRWGEVLFHLPTLISFAVAAMALTGGAIALAGLGEKPASA